MKLSSSEIIFFFSTVVTVDSLLAAAVTATPTEDKNNINIINRRLTRHLREQQQQQHHQYNNNEDNNNNRSLIVGGQQANAGDYPYFVGFGGDWWCGGTLISSEFVLTAAHCQFGVGDDVYIGEYESQTTKEGMTYKRQCIEWIEDPRFAQYTEFDKSCNAYVPPLYYDFALCKLNEPITIDQTKTKLILNSDPNYPPLGSNITMIGMGSINDHPFPAPVHIPKFDDTIDINAAEDSPNSNTDDYGGYVLRYPKFLQEVTSQIISNDECRESEFQACESLPMESCITDSEICNVYKYGSLEDGQDACWGDSGGPVFSRIDQGDGTFKDIHVGIVSWGDYCGNSNHPNINARTSSAFDFIKTIVCDEFGTNPEDASFCDGDDGTNNGVYVGGEGEGEGDESTTNLRPRREKMRDREQILQSSRLAPLD